MGFLELWETMSAAWKWPESLHSLHILLVSFQDILWEGFEIGGGWTVSGWLGTSGGVQMFRGVPTENGAAKRKRQVTDSRREKKEDVQQRKENKERTWEVD